MEIVLVRHTTPDIAKGICYGQADLDVVATFEQEAELIVSSLKHYNFDSMYSSPLQRCKKLAHKIGKDFIFDERLLELNFGDWELKPWDDIPKEEINPWMEDFVNQTPKNGESYVDLHKRTTSFIEEILKTSYDSVLIVTHAGVIRSLWAYFHQIPLEKSFDLKLEYGEMLTINTLDLHHES
ncbi:alpha-ribazole phosphatase [Tenacibaculum sp. 190524A05c]|uniref:alpha-ribazole phosphatase n=1 Tax=Tenacibaculum platacis TaxID=3137852 RepID=UPI0031FAB76C